jgi:hypothetical protein
MAPALHNTVQTWLGGQLALLRIFVVCLNAFKPIPWLHHIMGGLRLSTLFPVLYSLTRRPLDATKFVCLSVCLSACLSICLSVSLSINPSFYLSVCLSIYLSIHPSACLSFCLSVCLCICVYPPSIRSSTHLPTRTCNETIALFNNVYNISISPSLCFTVIFIDRRLARILRHERWN